MGLEAASIALITPTPQEFGGGNGLVGKIAKAIKRRVVVRPHSSIMLDEDDSHDAIHQIIPKKAEITDIWFDGALSTVIIHCKDPGLAVGKRGATLKELRDKIGWLVRLERTPPLESKQFMTYWAIGVRNQMLERS